MFEFYSCYENLHLETVSNNNNYYDNLLIKNKVTNPCFALSWAPEVTFPPKLSWCCLHEAILKTNDENAWGLRLPPEGSRRSLIAIKEDKTTK